MLDGGWAANDGDWSDVGLIGIVVVWSCSDRSDAASGKEAWSVSRHCDVDCGAVELLSFESLEGWEWILCLDCWMALRQYRVVVNVCWWQVLCFTCCVCAGMSAGSEMVQEWLSVSCCAGRSAFDICCR